MYPIPIMDCVIAADGCIRHLHILPRSSQHAATSPSTIVFHVHHTLHYSKRFRNFWNVHHADVHVHVPGHHFNRYWFGKCIGDVASWALHVLTIYIVRQTPHTSGSSNKNASATSTSSAVRSTVHSWQRIVFGAALVLTGFSVGATLVC
jgi:hypothetical protein